MEKISGDFIAGFVEGEGCFSLNNNNRRDSKSKSLRPMFSIGVNICDKKLLEKIQEEMGCGTIYLDKGPRKRGYDATHDLASFRVYKKQELCHKLVPFFDKYKLHGSKRIAFEIFKAILQIIGVKHIKTDEENNKLLELKNKMKNYVDEQ